MICSTLTPLCAGEGGSIFPQIAFTDRDGEAVIPNSASWTLVDGSGAIINDRENVNIPISSSTEEIQLEGDDLPWAGNFPTDEYSIWLYVKSQYEESGIGTTTQNQEVEIKITNRRAIS